MTEQDDLGEHLVDAATDGIITRQAVADTGQPLSAGAYARAAVTAALRELAARGWYLATDDGSMRDPGGMADEIVTSRRSLDV